MKYLVPKLLKVIMVSHTSPALSFILGVLGPKTRASCAVPLGTFFDFADRGDVRIVATVVAAYAVVVDCLETHLVLRKMVGGEDVFEVEVMMKEGEGLRWKG
jgi:hypothetical protein